MAMNLKISVAATTRFSKLPNVPINSLAFEVYSLTFLTIFKSWVTLLLIYAFKLVRSRVVNEFKHSVPIIRQVFPIC